MPRIERKKKDYMIKDLTGWIRKNMHMRGLTQEDIARELGITQQAVSERLNPKKYESGEMKDPFSYGDLLTLFKVLEFTPEEKERLLTL